jgi:hypothetical protein
MKVPVLALLCGLVCCVCLVSCSERPYQWSPDKQIGVCFWELDAQRGKKAVIRGSIRNNGPERDIANVHVVKCGDQWWSMFTLFNDAEWKALGHGDMVLHDATSSLPANSTVSVYLMEWTDERWPALSSVLETLGDAPLVIEFELPRETAAVPVAGAQINGAPATVGTEVSREVMSIVLER